MQTLPIKPEHQAELRYLLGDVFHLQRLDASQKEIANAMRRLAKRHLELYPELHQKRVAFADNCETMDVYDNREEWAQAIAEQAAWENEAPYVAFANDQAGINYDVLGPGKKAPDGH